MLTSDALYTVNGDHTIFDMDYETETILVSIICIEQRSIQTRQRTIILSIF